MSSETNFKVGDKVRCTSPEWPGRFSHSLEVGEVYTIQKIDDKGYIFVEEEIGKYYPNQFELFKHKQEKEYTMSDHDYDPEKIRSAIQQKLYYSPEKLGDAGPPQSAEEIEDGVKVYAPTTNKQRWVYFSVMGTWFNFEVPRSEIEKDPTIAEQFTKDDYTTITGEKVKRIIRYSDGSFSVIFSDGSKALTVGQVGWVSQNKGENDG